MGVCIGSLHISSYARGGGQPPKGGSCALGAGQSTVLFLGVGCWDRLPVKSSYLVANSIAVPTTAGCIAGLSHGVSLLWRSNQTAVPRNISIPHF